MNLRKYLKAPTPLLYIFAGGTAYTGELLLLFILHKSLGISAVTATAIAFWFGFLAAFLLQKVFAFKDYEKSLHAIYKQLGLYGVLVVFNYLFTLVLVGSLPESYLLFTRTLALVLTTTWNFFIYKYFIFGKGIDLSESWQILSKKYLVIFNSLWNSKKTTSILTALAWILLAGVSSYAAIQTSRITATSSDALVHTYLVGDGIKDAGIRLQPEHTNLIKFPLFYLQAKLGYSYASFVVLNISLTLATTLGWAYLVIRIFGRRYALLTLLSMSSVVLGSAVLNLNMNWTTIRNIEFPLALLFVFVVARYLQKNKPDRRAILILVGNTFLYGLLLASDVYFQYTISLAIFTYIVIAYIQSRAFTSNMLHVVVAVASASIIGKLILWGAERVRYLEIISSGDFGMKIIPIDTITSESLVAIRYLLSVMGGNIFGTMVRVTNIPVFVNFLILSLALVAAVVILKNANHEFYTLRKRIEVVKVDPVLTILAIGFILSFLLYILSGQVGGGDKSTHRYIVLSAFLIIPLFIWFISHYYKDHRALKLFIAVLLLVSIALGGKIASRTYSLHEGYELPKKQAYIRAASILSKEGVDVFLSGHWYGSSTRFWSENELGFATVSGCDGRFIALNRDGWYRPDPYIDRSALLIERKGYDQPFWAQCPDSQLVNIYGQPDKVISINDYDHIWIYNYDIRGKITH